MLRIRPQSLMVLGLVAGALGVASIPLPASAQSSSKSEFPPHDQVLSDFKKVVSTIDGEPTFYTIWVREKDGQMLAELPKGYTSQKHFIALTVASGETYAGLQAGELYVYWKRFDKRLGLFTPNIEIRSTGDKESKASVNRLFTDRLVLDVPIVTIGPSGNPIIDMDALLVGQASQFFGPSVRVMNTALATIAESKAFKENVELAFEVPVVGGQMKTLHYSISLIKSDPKYKPRLADERIGYFTTAYTDLGKYKETETRVRYINRWHLEKRDPSLKISPPEEPIVFYIEHTAPVRYRRWIRKGILYWNKAFERIGLSNAIEVEYQDAVSGRHMEKDPEDVQYNFVRWLNNNIGTAIGPSRVNPMTGQILDADIILTDGWIRHYWNQFHEVLPAIAMEGFTPETLAWLAEHPDWDPRIRLASPANRRHLKAEIARTATLPLGGHDIALVDPTLIGDNPYDGLVGRISQVNGLCLASQGKSFDMAIMRMTLALAAEELAAKGEEKADDEKDDGEKEKDEDDEDDVSMIDGMPESFVGPLVAELVAHEVGHTLGLRHNFKASSIYSLEEINSPEIKGKKPFAGSVMDYLPVNIRMEAGEVQGDRAMLGIGPYDYWAIEYGYTFEKDLDPILARVAEPELQFGTDEDTIGPDPYARRYDFGKDPLEYAKEQIRLAQHHRERIIDKFVKEGQSWSHARRGYELTLALQTRSISMMANWIGGAFVHRDKKGDKNARLPIEVVPVEKQRNALDFVLENTFKDEAFGLSTELLRRMTVDKWLDGDGYRSAFTEEPTWPVHDRIMGVQASTLTMLMNPSTLRRVYDNEFLIPADQDALTLPELLSSLSDCIWSELDQTPDKQYTARVPMVTSLRRNLQREHMERLISLTMPGNGSIEAYKPISNLAMMELRKIRDKIAHVQKEGGEKIDPYTTAHFTKVTEEITKTLESQMIYNANDIGGRGGATIIILGEDGEVKEVKN